MIKSKIHYLFPLPFIYNFFNNFLNNNFKFDHIDTFSIMLSLAYFTFLLTIGHIISDSLEINNLSLSIGLFLMSFFVVNFFTLYFDKFLLSFHNYFYITVVLWIFVFLINYKKIKINKLFTLLITFFITKLLSNNYSTMSLRHKELSTDTTFFWTPMSKMIYENSLFYSLENNIISGYGLLINYIHAVNFKLIFDVEIFSYSPATTNVFLFLGLLFIYELRVKKPIKLSASLIYVSILVNSDWLSFLFFNSTMGEVITNYLFTIFFLFIFGSKTMFEDNIQIRNRYLVLTFSGFLYFSKPFVSYLILIAIFILFIIEKDMRILFSGFFGLLINFLNYRFVISGNIQDGYLNSSEISNINSLTNLNFDNIFTIFKNFYLLDKVTSLFIFFLLVILIFNFLKFRSLSKSTIIIFLNLILVFYLYSSIWESKELESAYRYILTFINLYFFVYVDEIKKL